MRKMNNENECIKCKTKLSDFEKRKFAFLCGNCKAQNLERKGELFGVYCKDCKKIQAYFDKKDYKSNKKYYCSKCGNNNTIVKKNDETKKEKIIKELKNHKKDWGPNVHRHIDDIIKNFDRAVKYEDTRRNIEAVTGIKVKK